MKSSSEEFTDNSDFRRKSTLGVALASLLILTPFSINNFFNDRFFLGVGSLVVVVILAYNAWSISRGRYHSSLILLVLVPVITFFLLLALHQQGIIGALWCYPAVVSFYMILPERKAWIANIAFLAIIFPQVWILIDQSLAARVTATLLAVSIFSAIFIRVITNQQKRLHEYAIKDPLTGLYNRTLLDTLLHQAIQQSKRTNVAMTILIIDIDHFKSINDTYGHDAGDTVLREVSELLLGRMRSVDKVFRLGGEEFLALLFGTDAESSKQVAEELRHAVSSLRIVSGQSSITASIGIATLSPGEDSTAWIKRADENLYHAKQQGRNRVVL